MALTINGVYQSQIMRWKYYTNPSFDLSWSMLTRYGILIENRISKH